MTTKISNFAQFVLNKCIYGTNTEEETVSLFKNEHLRAELLEEKIQGVPLVFLLMKHDSKTMDLILNGNENKEDGPLSREEQKEAYDKIKKLADVYGNSYLSYFDYQCHMSLPWNAVQRMNLFVTIDNKEDVLKLIHEENNLSEGSLLRALKANLIYQTIVNKKELKAFSDEELRDYFKSFVENHPDSKKLPFNINTVNNNSLFLYLLGKDEDEFARTIEIFSDENNFSEMSHSDQLMQMKNSRTESSNIGRLLLHVFNKTCKQENSKYLKNFLFDVPDFLKRKLLPYATWHMLDYAETAPNQVAFADEQRKAFVKLFIENLRNKELLNEFNQNIKEVEEISTLIYPEKLTVFKETVLNEQLKLKLISIDNHHKEKGTVKTRRKISSTP